MQAPLQNSDSNLTSNSPPNSVTNLIPESATGTISDNLGNPDDIFTLVNGIKRDDLAIVPFSMEKVIAEKKELEDVHGKYTLIKNVIPFYWHVKNKEGISEIIDIGDHVEYINIEYSFDKSGKYIGSIFGNVIGIDNQFITVSMETGGTVFKFLMSENSKMLNFTKLEKPKPKLDIFGAIFNKNTLIVSCFVAIVVLLISLFAI